MFWSLKIKYTLQVCIHLPLQCFCQRKLFLSHLSQKSLGSSGCFKWKMPINYLEIYVGLVIFSSLHDFIRLFSVIIMLVKTKHVRQIGFNTLSHLIIQNKTLYDMCMKLHVLV